MQTFYLKLKTQKLLFRALSVSVQLIIIFIIASIVKIDSSLSFTVFASLSAWGFCDLFITVIRLVFYGSAWVIKRYKELLV